jgi:hypothetical protein
MGTPEEVEIEEVWALLHGVAMLNSKANQTMPLLTPNLKHFGTSEAREGSSAALMCIRL